MVFNVVKKMLILCDQCVSPVSCNHWLSKWREKDRGRAGELNRKRRMESEREGGEKVSKIGDKEAERLRVEDRERN